MTFKEFRDAIGVHITTDHNGKMSGLASLSTSVIINPYCQMRAREDGTICQKCYAARMAAMYNPLAACLETNTEVLTSRVIPVNEWPTLNYYIFRLESFGDLVNITQFHNYCNFCKKNPRTTFALWTKNPEIIADALTSGIKKPRNLIVVQSSEHLNKVDAPQYDFIDKVFTVYDARTIEADGIAINCGARSCLTCQRCYTKKRGVEYINEKLHK